MKFRLCTIVLLLTMFSVSTSCNWGGNDKIFDDWDNGVHEPDPPIDLIPIPYSELYGEIICDMAWELDGDLVVSTQSTTFLFNEFGELKRDDFGPPCVMGLANNDSGLGISYYISSNITCAPSGLIDDKNATEGDFTTVIDSLWLNGKPSPDIPGQCDLSITMDWSCPDGVSTSGYAYHPFTNRTYIILNCNDTIIGDSDCESDWLDNIGNEVNISSICGSQPLTNVILSYDQSAPFLDGWWNGYPDEDSVTGGDWCVYVDYDKWKCLQELATLAPGYQRMVNAVRVISMNGSYPLSANPVPRDGLNVGNITDFEFDAQGRMIATVTESDVYFISRPIVDGEHIILDRLIGGRTNGMGTGPGEFQGPTGIAVNQMNQQHIICDQGNDRVQIFTSQGDFILQYRTGPAPHKALVDLWGNLIVATDNGKEMYNQLGYLPVYGSIEGFVLDKGTGLPVENATVSIINAFDLTVPTALTTEDGYFSISTVPAGTHTLVVSKALYFDTSTSLSVNAAECTNVTFHIERGTVDPAHSGNVTGTLINADSPSEGDEQGIPDLVVSIMGISDVTDSDGEFLLIGVSSGLQKLQIRMNGQLVWQGNIQVQEAQTLDLGLIYLNI